ncbi:helix-turn-helix domain-containing protein [Rubritepida flocculans]|uniref:helix-turn-helix domain-containing protein n=1 Tax=Rubritepida flocculans TaxID=182403 RepID=UPI0009FD9240|nr:helix-turn-helix domain-containing protein [Rubritepida flocculans]
MLTRRFLTMKEVADVVQVSEATVRHWIRLRELRAIDLGREWRVIPRDLEAFLAAHETCREPITLGAVGTGTTQVEALGDETASDLPCDGLRPRGSRCNH